MSDDTLKASQGKADDPLIGKLLADRFRVDGLLGEGGVGKVYRGEHVELRRPVAIKVLHDHLAGQEAMRARFLREARAASMINHPGSVVIYDFGDWEGRLYLAMEYLEGETLAAVGEREFPLSSERIAELIGQLCSVLEAANEKELVHRDLKPENVILVTGRGGDEEIKVVDFGLATLLDPESDMRLTRDGMVSGTPDYMSPEQARGHDLDHRSDLYSVGVILYELLCNRTPFAGESPMDVMLAHLYATPAPPSHHERSGQVDQHLQRIALWALAKNPAERPQTATELREALADVSGGASGPDRGALKGLDRESRAQAAGLRRPTGTHAIMVTADPLTIVVMQPPAVPFTESATGPLRAGGHKVVELSSLDELAARVADAGGDAVVVDLRPEPQRALDVLEAAIGAGALGDRPALVVGPDDDFDAMSRALTIGTSDYVPASAVTGLPKKVGRAVKRARRQRRS